jgi:hypothetical protein
LNSELGDALKVLHGWMGKSTNYKIFQDSLEQVRKDNGRVKAPNVLSSVVTQWNLSFDKTASANANQCDPDIAIQRLLLPVMLLKS